MTTYNAAGFAVKTTPADHVIDPTCGATNGRHGLTYAHRYERCTCPGPAWDTYRAQRDATNARQRARKEADKAEREAVVTRMTPAGSSGLRELTAAEAARPQRRAAFVEAGAAEREFRKRDDKACVAADPDVFELTGTGKTADRQLAEAQQWCNRCPARTACLAAALERGEQWTVAAGYSPAQLEQMRRKQVAA